VWSKQLAQTPRFRHPKLAVAIVLVVAVIAVALHSWAKRQGYSKPNANQSLSDAAGQEWIKWRQLQDEYDAEYERLMANAPTDAEGRSKFEQDEVFPKLESLELAAGVQKRKHYEAVQKAKAASE
jgi:hypothetical protein